MIYLTEDDIEVIITDYTLLDLLEATTLESGSTILDGAEKTAIDITFSYISNIYDKDVELSKTGDTRDYMIVNSVTSLVQYLLYQRVSTDLIPAHIDTTYERTIEMLRDIQNRKINPVLDKKLSTDATYVPRISSDSNTPRTSYDY